MVGMRTIPNYQVTSQAESAYLVGSVEGMSEGAALPQNHPESPHIGLMIVRGAFAQLGGEVIRCPDQSVREVLLCA
eukprot:897886-Pyramimonas_sp.AAC.2